MIQWKLNTGICGAVIIASMMAGCVAPHATPNQTTLSAETPATGSFLTASASGERRLVRVYFNPYTDSIKTVLNYYVNVEGEYSDGTFLPLDTTEIILRSDVGTMAGNEWVIPKKIDFEKVTFTATARANPKLNATKTLWIQKWKDPRDAADYKDPSEETERRR